MIQILSTLARILMGFNVASTRDSHIWLSFPMYLPHLIQYNSVASNKKGINLQSDLYDIFVTLIHLYAYNYYSIQSSVLELEVSHIMRYLVLMALSKEHSLMICDIAHIPSTQQLCSFLSFNH